MLEYHAVAAFAAAQVTRQFRRWVFRLGGIGFIPLGLLDSSVIPLPGSMDVLVIVLSGRQKQLWLYYAIMATVGSVMGSLVTYNLARKGGKEALERKISKQGLEKVRKKFEKWGAGAVLIPAILPPPIPFVPFVLAAGAMQYPLGKFVALLSLGRMARYTLLAFLAERYGRPLILGLLSQTEHPLRLIIITVALAAVAAAIVVLRGKRHRHAQA